MGHIISVNNNLCVGCSQCIKDCPQNNIVLDDNKKAKIKSQDCMKCGHCMAICPQYAINISGYSEDPYDTESMELLDSEKLMNSLISRRSIRQFKSEDVSYIVIDKKKRLVEDLAIKIFKRLLRFLKVFNKSMRDMEIDEDFFFKKAPLAIMVIADSKVDGSLAASNMALMAESLGIGVLYSGFFTVATSLSGKIKKELGIRSKKAVTTLVLGYPDVKYKRSTQREDAEIIYR